MEEQQEIKSNVLVFSDKMLQIVQDLSKYGKIIGALIIGQWVLGLCLAIGYLLFADGMTLALLFMGIYLIPTVKLVMSGLLLVFLIGLNLFVGISMYRFGMCGSKGIEMGDNKKIEDGMRWLKNACMSIVVGIVLAVVLVALS